MKDSPSQEVVDRRNRPPHLSDNTYIDCLLGLDNKTTDGNITSWVAARGEHPPPFAG